MIDPKKIITTYGADSARLFILSDSPPEKDVQWSDEGINSSYKFIQKLWSLNERILNEISLDHETNNNDELTKFTNQFIKKMTENLNTFSYNKLIANLHEMYAFLSKEITKKYKKKTIIENYNKILITMIPIIPHFANECLEKNNFSKDLKWPDFDQKILTENKVKFVIQINGKKRALIETKINILEEELFEILLKETSLKKYFFKKEIRNKRFVPNKLINIITN